MGMGMGSNTGSVIPGTVLQGGVSQNVQSGLGFGSVANTSPTYGGYYLDKAIKDQQAGLGLQGLLDQQAAITLGPTQIAPTDYSLGPIASYLNGLPKAASPPQPIATLNGGISASGGTASGGTFAPTINANADTTNTANLTNVGNTTVNSNAYSGAGASGRTPPMPISPTGSPWMNLPAAPNVSSPTPFNPVSNGLSPGTPLGPMAGGNPFAGMAGGGGPSQPGVNVLPQQAGGGNPAGPQVMPPGQNPGGGPPRPMQPQMMQGHPMPGAPMTMPGGMPMRANPAMMTARAPLSPMQRSAAGQSVIASNGLQPPPPPELGLAAAGAEMSGSDQPYEQSGGDVPGVEPYKDLARSTDPEMAQLDEAIGGGRKAVLKEAQKYGDKAFKIAEELPTREKEAVDKAIAGKQKEIDEAREDATQAHGRMRAITITARNPQRQAEIRAGIERDAEQKFPDPETPVHWNAHPDYGPQTRAAKSNADASYRAWQEADDQVRRKEKISQHAKELFDSMPPAGKNDAWELYAETRRDLREAQGKAKALKDEADAARWQARGVAFQNGARGYFQNARNVAAYERVGYDPAVKQAFDANMREHDQYDTDKRMIESARGNFINSQIIRVQQKANSDWSQAHTEAQDAQKRLSELERARDKAAKEARITALSEAQRQIAGIGAALRSDSLKRGVMQDQSNTNDKKVGRTIQKRNSDIGAINAKTGTTRESRLDREGKDKHALDVKKEERQVAKDEEAKKTAGAKEVTAKEKAFLADRKSGVATSHQAFDVGVEKGDLPKTFEGKPMDAEKYDRMYQTLKKRPDLEEQWINRGINTARLKRIGDSANER